MVMRLACPSSLKGYGLELDSHLLGDELGAGEDGDVFQHGLAAITEARCLYRRYLQGAAQFVDHQRRERLIFDVLMCGIWRVAIRTSARH